MSKKIIPGEWQTEVNQYGGTRRYRMVGNIKEYEPTVTINGIEVPQSELAAFHERNKAQTAAQIEASKRAAQTQKTYACPFNGGNHSCKREKCALYGGDGCTLAQIAARATTDTAGKSCPFSPYTCRADCGLYKSGCVLTAIKERT